MTEVAARSGVSRQSVHAWLRRYEQGGLGALADRSRRPGSCPHQVSAEVEAAVCERPKSSYRRWERDEPMALWQLDIVGGVFLVSGTEAKVVTGVDVGRAFRGGVDARLRPVRDRAGRRMDGTLRPEGDRRNEEHR